jgi:hypothetical protein
MSPKISSAISSHNINVNMTYPLISQERMWKPFAFPVKGYQYPWPQTVCGTLPMVIIICNVTSPLSSRAMEEVCPQHMDTARLAPAMQSTRYSHGNSHTPLCVCVGEGEGSEIAKNLKHTYQSLTCKTYHSTCCAQIKAGVGSKKLTILNLGIQVLRQTYYIVQLHIFCTCNLNDNFTQS